MFTKLKIYFTRKRILETKNGFIPQVWSAYGWQGIQVNDEENKYQLWCIFQNDHCLCKTLEQANNVFQCYYDIKYPAPPRVHPAPEREPKFWRILKDKN